MVSTTGRTSVEWMVQKSVDMKVGLLVGLKEIYLVDEMVAWKDSKKVGKMVV